VIKKSIILITIFLVGYFISSKFIKSIDRTSVKKTKLSFSITKYDFGNLQKNQNAKFYFKYTNLGRNPLLLEKINTTCGCTVANWSKEELRVNEKDSLLISYDTSKPGYFTKEIMVYSNSETSPDHIFIKGIVLK
jgi:hypothetical protein